MWVSYPTVFMLALRRAPTMQLCYSRTPERILVCKREMIYPCYQETTVATESFLSYALLIAEMKTSALLTHNKHKIISFPIFSVKQSGLDYDIQTILSMSKMTK